MGTNNPQYKEAFIEFSNMKSAKNALSLTTEEITLKNNTKLKLFQTAFLTLKEVENPQMNKVYTRPYWNPFTSLTRIDDF